MAPNDFFGFGDNGLGSGVTGTSGALSMLGIQTPGPVWYGPLPFFIPTKVVQTYGSLITKDKTDSNRSIYGMAEENTIVSVAGYFKGSSRRFWKEMLVQIRLAQLWLNYNTKMAAEGTWNPKFSALSLGLGSFGAAIASGGMRFPFISPLSLEMDMYIKSMVFTHGAEQMDTYTFILNLEKPRTDVRKTYSSRVTNIFMGITAIGVIAAFMSNLATSFSTNSMNKFTGGLPSLEAIPTSIDSYPPVPIPNTGEFHYQLALQSESPDFDPLKTWYDISPNAPLNTQRWSSSFTFSGSSATHFLSLEWNGVKTPQNGYYFVPNATLTIYINGSNHVVWSGQPREGVTYFAGSIRFGFKTLRHTEDTYNGQPVLRTETCVVIASYG